MPCWCWLRGIVRALTRSRRCSNAVGSRWWRHSTANAGAAASIDGAASAASAAVLLLDTIGELENFYAAADVAFVGGSLAPIGGHNLLEPAVLGVATLAGPSQGNAPDVARAPERKRWAANRCTTAPGSARR